MNKIVLVTGGAGYIGSNTAYHLYQSGYTVMILDSFRYGQSFDPSWAKVIKGDCADPELLDNIFQTNEIEGVFHFAGLIEVGASMKDPALFYQENVIKTIKLLQKMREHNVNKIVFSSSAAVYGIPKEIPISEESVCDPINPYGQTKLMVEKILADYHKAYGLKYAALRYFNAAGANTELMLGENHEPETHLIPNLLKATQESSEFSMFGDDYSTPDGSCIRDYLHVKDLAEAHRLAFEYLSMQPTLVGNLGTGKGFSIRELIEATEKVTNLSLKYIVRPRRVGDPDILVANSSKIQELLLWEPYHSDIENIISDAWQFYNKLVLNKEKEINL